MSKLGSFYAIQFVNGRVKKWAEFSSGRFDLVKRFTINCLVDKHQADSFMSFPGLDSRYKIVKINCTTEELK